MQGIISSAERVGTHRIAPFSNPALLTSPDAPVTPSAPFSPIAGVPSVAISTSGQSYTSTESARADVVRSPRWSGDAWVLWRPGASNLTSGAPVPLYGGSQTGAVLRYLLAPASRVHPFAFVRAVQALDGSRDGDLAAGLGVRPLAGVPVTAHAEMRLSRRKPATEVRPAAYVSGGFEEVSLVTGVVARGYGQVGYVGGSDATSFVDGSIVADAPVSETNGSQLTMGIGAWGGAQRGSGRLDIGPTANLRVRVGEGTARLSADYRLRVAGNAAPTSGAAVTISAGF